MSPFQRLIGQSQAVELLQQAIALDRIAPAYLFAGPSGTGRALAAQCFSHQLFCYGQPKDHDALIRQKLVDRNHPDFLWVQPTYLHKGRTISASEAADMGLKRKATPQIRLAQIREITQFLSRPPLEANRTVVVIEEAETMAEAAANGLLKTLEEPGKATLILIASSRDALLPTLTSRCQHIAFYRLPQQQMAEVLHRCQAQTVLDYPELLRMAQGSPGQAIASWKQLQTIPEALHQRLSKRPQSAIEALTLAQAIAKELDTQAQLWLVDYLESLYWQQWQGQECLTQLEKVRHYLSCYVQPRLVWECTFLSLINADSRL